MRIPRFYIEKPLQVNTEIVLPDTVHRHAIQVLKLKSGEKIILFNGQAGEYLAEFSLVEKRSSHVRIISFDSVNRESPLTVSLAIALIKPDKMDFAIQKGVEMGVSSIQPLSTDRSIIKLKDKRLLKKLSHWQSVVNSACEQSGRTTIPEVLPPTSLDGWLLASSDTFRIAMDPQSEVKMHMLKKPEEVSFISLLIGPEGGFTDQELLKIKQNNVVGFNCGPRILRAETAVVAGITLCQQLWGDL